MGKKQNFENEVTEDVIKEESTVVEEPKKNQNDGKKLFSTKEGGTKVW